MKVPAFDQTRRRWDAFKAFHCSVDGGFIQFETGDIIYTRWSPDPDLRQHYKDVNVQIVSTTDADCPRLYTEDDTPVVSAWMNRGSMQYLAVDWELKLAVGLTKHRWYPEGALSKDNEFDQQVPDFLAGRFAVYWSGSGRKPVGAPIEVAPPRKFTPDERDQLQGLKDQCVAWCAIHNIEPVMYKRTVTMPESGKLTPVDAVAVDPLNVLGVSMLTLTEVHRIQIASLGYTPCYDATKHKYLKVR